MKQISLKTRGDVMKTRQAVLALESCCCQGARSGQALTDQSFVLEDMAAMLPLIPEFSSDEKHLYQLTNQTIARSLDPENENPDVTVLPSINTTTVATEDFDDVKAKLEAFSKKVSHFTKNVVSITNQVNHTLQKGYLWLTEHQTDLHKKLGLKSKGYQSSLRDGTIILHGWYHNGEGIGTVTEAIKASNHFLSEQLPTLLEYCKHALFVMNEADEVLDDALSMKTDEQRITRLYKAHNAANVERIFGGAEYEVLGHRQVTVSETPTRARTDNEMITAITSVQVNFDALDKSTYKPVNTPSATESEAAEILKVSEAILKAIDVTEPNNPVATLRRNAQAFEKRVAKLEEILGKATPENEEDEKNYRTIVDAARMFSALRLQAMNFSVSTYSTATIIVEQLLGMIKLKD